MSRGTPIEWCDDTVNAQMGCDGCELWQPSKGVNVCYAGTIIEKMKGTEGWPKSFDHPEIFPGRIEDAVRWSDLSGQPRQEKPWLDGLPRLIFLDDMGDTFTESLPVDWLLPYVRMMMDSPHIWLFLTKRPKRMRTFFNTLGYVPSNFWLGVSVTSERTLSRATELLKIDNATLFLSVEPLSSMVNLTPYLHQLSWIIVGGQSGTTAPRLPLAFIRAIINQCRREDTPFFLKQLGAAYGTAAKDNRKGEDWDYWPDDLKVREMPEGIAKRMMTGTSQLPLL